PGRALRRPRAADPAACGDLPPRTGGGDRRGARRGLSLFARPVARATCRLDRRELVISTAGRDLLSGVGKRSLRTGRSAPGGDGAPVGQTSLSALAAAAHPCAAGTIPARVTAASRR